MGNKVSIGRKAFIKEHEDLTRVLKSGNKQQLKQEYQEQSAELKGIKGHLRRKLQ